jgi:hypothetical protein
MLYYGVLQTFQANQMNNQTHSMFVSGKSQNPRCFKNVKSLPTEYVTNKKAWMTSEIFTNWLHQINKKMTKKKRSIVMIVDNCPAHPHASSTSSSPSECVLSVGNWNPAWR